MKMKNVVLRLVGLGLTALVGFVLNYFFLPAWNIHSGGLWAFVFCILFIFGIVNAIIATVSNSDKSFDFAVPLVSIILAILVIVIGLILLWASTPMFNASNYHQMIEIEEVDASSFTEDIISINDNIPIVDLETARRLGDRQSAQIEHPEWFETNQEYNLVEINGEYFRVSALEYNGNPFKYSKAKNNGGLKGYVLVNAMNQEATLVETEGMFYTPSSMWECNLKRHLRNLYPSAIFGETYAEPDDNGKLWYITSVRTKTIGLFGGWKETSFIITDPVNGETTEYLPEKLPEWVDHAYSLDYLMTAIYYNQRYINGFKNAWGSKTDVKQTTYQYRHAADGENNLKYFAGYNSTIGKNGEIYFSTGVTPVNASEANTGFILVSPKTGKVKLYSVDGAEEASAQAAAEGLVQNLSYSATFPFVVNVDGIETYLMTLKDNAGLVQKYALCNIKNYSIVVEDSTLEGALKKYRERMGTDTTPTTDVLSAEGTITALYTAEIDGFTFYFFTINDSSTLYKSSIVNSSKQVTLKIGDTIKIDYTNSSEEDVALVQSIQF